MVTPVSGTETDGSQGPVSESARIRQLQRELATLPVERDSVEEERDQVATEQNQLCASRDDAIVALHKAIGERDAARKESWGARAQKALADEQQPAKEEASNKRLKKLEEEHEDTPERLESEISQWKAAGQETATMTVALKAAEQERDKLRCDIARYGSPKGKGQAVRM